MNRWCVLVLVTLVLCTGSVSGADKDQLRIATFNVDATPPIGSPVAYVPARKIEDPLSARGIVLLGAGKPIVICAVDWIGIGNSGYDVWRGELAEAAGTTTDRVTVHAIHQHDGPRCDFAAAKLLEEYGLAEEHFDVEFARKVIRRTAEAIRVEIGNSQPVTHIGLGKAKVEKVASNRRILGPDGKVRKMRFSSCKDPEAIAAPEGVIDPYLRLVSFWNGERALVTLMYYASHPQSHYLKGDVTSEFVGLARAQREKEVPGVLQIYFTGAGGNIAAGKYNDGSPENRPVLTARMAKAMKAAWESMEKRPITASQVEWRIESVKLVPGAHLDEAKLRAEIANKDEKSRQRLNAASHLAWLLRCRAGHLTELSCLRLGDTYILHMPGELFVEYQLAAQQMRPKDMVCLAAYSDYGPGYIGTEIAYEQGGYETGPDASLVSPKTEQILLTAISKLLR
ncbi:MAG: hypothetical protein JXD22_08750 [Sedimentisphaerales bacterium]|nr:hypothetical protein [Sedimentisphaerales bacterium]